MALTVTMVKKKKAYSSDEMQIFLVKALTLNLLHNYNQITSFSPRSGALNVIFPGLRNLSFLSLFIFPLKIFQVNLFTVQNC